MNVLKKLANIFDMSVWDHPCWRDDVEGLEFRGGTGKDIRGRPPCGRNIAQKVNSRPVIDADIWKHNFSEAPSWAML